MVAAGVMVVGVCGGGNDVQYLHVEMDGRVRECKKDPSENTVLHACSIFRTFLLVLSGHERAFCAAGNFGLIEAYLDALVSPHGNMTQAFPQKCRILAFVLLQ